MNWILDLRLLSLDEVGRPEPTYPYFFRRVFRWYGKTFGMDPKAVEELPLWDVLQHYFEDEYEALSPEDRILAIQELLDLADPKAAEKRREVKTLEDKKFEELDVEAIFKKKAEKAKSNKKSQFEEVKPPADDFPFPEVIKFPDLTSLDAEDMPIRVEDPGFGLEPDSPRPPPPPRRGRLPRGR